jgi:replicative DNA helicase
MNIEQIITSMLISGALSFTKYKLTEDMFFTKEYKTYIQYLSKNNGVKPQDELNQIFLSKSNNKEIFLSLFELEKVLDVFKLKTVIELLYKNVIKTSLKLKIDMIEGSLTDKTALQEVEEILKEVTGLIKELSEEIVVINSVDTYREYLSGVITHLEENNVLDGVVGVSSGIRELDKLTCGFKAAEYVIVAGRPSMGKTSLALDIVAENILNGLNVLVMSIEMPAAQIVARLIPKIIKELTLGNSLYAVDYELKKDLINKALSIIEGSNLRIEDFRNMSSVTMADIEKIAEKYEDDYGHIDIGIIDYVQLLKSTIKASDENSQMSDNSRRIKALCKKTNAPWIALSQLNRSLEERADKRPLNSDLRSSGALEQDADLIIFPYRDAIYLEKSLKEQISKKPENAVLQEALDSLRSTAIEMSEVIVSKNRNGPTGTAGTQFKKNSASYINIGDGIEFFNDNDF